MCEFLDEFSHRLRIAMGLGAVVDVDAVVGYHIRSQTRVAEVRVTLVGIAGSHCLGPNLLCAAVSSQRVSLALVGPVGIRRPLAVKQIRLYPLIEMAEQLFAKSIVQLA